MFSQQWCIGDHKPQRGTADVQTEGPEKPFPSLLQLFYWEKLSARMLRFFPFFLEKSGGEGGLAMKIPGCDDSRGLQALYLSSNSAETLDKWFVDWQSGPYSKWKCLRLFTFLFLTPLDIERHQEMSLSLDFSVCKDWAMWHSHKCHDSKESSVSMAVLLLFCQHGVTLCYHRLPLPSLEIPLEIVQEN